MRDAGVGAKRGSGGWGWGGRWNAGWVEKRGAHALKREEGAAPRVERDAVCRASVVPDELRGVVWGAKNG